MDAFEEELVGVEGGAVCFVPGGDERGGEVAGRDVGQGQDGGLQVVGFLHVGLEEGDAFFRETCQNDAFYIPLSDAFRRHFCNILAEFLVV